MVTTIDRARLLIRVANSLGEHLEGERRSLLQWAEELLGGATVPSGSLASAPEAEGVTVRFPLPIFRTYRGTRFDALLLEDERVQLNGQVFSSPSAAAIAVSGHNENGWRGWKFRNPITEKGEIIDTLRAQGLVKRH